ncbi:MAG TPA: hypothetical protein VGB77_06260 [Abditibacteriaceae bacterium]|jgi:methyl-accepting chemotaxis protein
MTPEVTVVNFPTVAIWIIALSQLLLALGVIAVLALFGSQISAILKDIKLTIEDMRREAMPPVVATLKNVKTMSDDAARTTHKVTDTADRVTNLVSTVVSRAESPAVKAAGLLSGVVAGARAVRNAKKVEDEPKKKGGKRGLFR